MSRSRGRQTTTGKDSKDQEKAEDVESDTQIPVFVCKVTLVGDCITITPDLEKFENGFHNLLTRLNESVESVPVLFDDNVFNPYSQPILYGKMENYKVSFYIKGPFNKYVDKMREAGGRRGQKNVCFCPRSGYKKCPRRGVKQWQNSVHVVVECLLVHNPHSGP